MVTSNVSQVSPVSHIPSASAVARSPLGTTLDALRASLGRYQTTFDAARARRADLGMFASPEAVAVALERSSSLKEEARYALVAALVREHVSHPGGPALWSSLLLVAFRPLLLRARSQLGRPQDTERDARVLAAFLDALGRIRMANADVYATVALQRGLLKALGRARAVDKQDAADAAFDEDEHTRCEPHALTLGDACADLAWAESRERKLASIPRWKTDRARVRASTPLPSSTSATPLRLQFRSQPIATFTGVSP